MPRIIHQVLAKKLLESETLRELFDDFSRASGLRLRFMTQTGVEHELSRGLKPPEACHWMKQDRDGCSICLDTCLKSAEQPEKIVECPLGMVESAIPLSACGETYGYILAGQVSTRSIGPKEINSWRQHLEKKGQEWKTSRLSELADSIKIISESRLRSAIRLLKWLVPEIERLHTPEIRKIHEPDQPYAKGALPASINKACLYVKRNYMREINLGSVASVAGMSRTHFCATFRKHTLIKFSEYLTNVRIERAKDRLSSTNDMIAKIAYDCGFQSISTFNRAFRASTKLSPRSFRREQGS